MTSGLGPKPSPWSWTFSTKNVFFLTLPSSGIFGDCGDCLMCYPHVNRNIKPRIDHLKKASGNPTLGIQVLKAYLPHLIFLLHIVIQYKMLIQEYYANGFYCQKLGH